MLSCGELPCRLHDRMPVLLPTQEARDAWLAPEFEASTVKDVRLPYDGADLVWHEVPMSRELGPGYRQHELDVYMLSEITCPRSIANWQIVQACTLPHPCAVPALLVIWLLQGVSLQCAIVHEQETKRRLYAIDEFHSADVCMQICTVQVDPAMGSPRVQGPQCCKPIVRPSAASFFQPRRGAAKAASPTRAAAATKEEAAQTETGVALRSEPHAKAEHPEDERSCNLPCDQILTLDLSNISLSSRVM